MPSTRCFIAIPTSAEVKDSISRIQSRLKESQADVRWEPPEKFHMTLKFLGAVEASTLDSLTARLELLLKNVSSLRTTFITVGGFPSAERPRVVWIGTEPNESLMKLQSDVESLCASLGFTKEDRAFHPHITLGRVKGTRNLRSLTATLKSVTFEPIQALCSEVLLMKSDLKPGGSVYTALQSFPLLA